jgi:hypothetical protein|tara:strand:+ start:487 stop:603 length:117 start_codon:yes stop_codon:yes gene_type:complete
MPGVGKKKYPYTTKGLRAAKVESKRAGKAIRYKKRVKK